MLGKIEGAIGVEQYGSQPTCDEKIAPTVTFYLEGSDTEICHIDMNQGRGWKYNNCLANVKATANRGDIHNFVSTLN